MCVFVSNGVRYGSVSRNRSGVRIMSVSCPLGWTQHTAPNTPPNSTTLTGNNGYVRVTHVWKLADNSVPPTCACGQTASFNFGYGYTSGGELTITPLGVGGSVSAGLSGYTELTVNVGGDGFEYVAYKIVLEETTETGTVSKSGGFSGGGVLKAMKFAWNTFWHGPAALIPSLTYNAPDSITKKFVQAGWKICRKPCPATKSKTGIGVKAKSAESGKSGQKPGGKDVKKKPPMQSRGKVDG